MMEYCDFVPEDVVNMFEDWQDLSQYSYDPEDQLETVTLLDSQQSSQASDKTDVFLGCADEQKPSEYVDVQDVPACLNANNEIHQPVIAEDTGELCDYFCLTDVTDWVGNADGLAAVSNSQELPSSVSQLEDEHEHTFTVQVLKAEPLLSNSCVSL